MRPHRQSLPEPGTPRSQGARGLVAVLERRTQDDASLVERLIGGDAHAVAAIIDRYSHVVRGVLIRTMGSTIDIDDLMQETFLVISQRSDTLRDPGAFRSFVVSVAVRVVRNELRRRSFRRFIGLEDVPAPPITPPHDPEVAQGVRSLYAAMNRLDANSRIAFVVRHAEGYDLTETAAICGCSLATVKRRLARAEKCFARVSREDPVLSSMLGEGKEGS